MANSENDPEIDPYQGYKASSNDIYIYIHIKSMELRSNLEGSKTDTNRLAERPPGTSAGRTARNSERKRERELWDALGMSMCG